MNSNSSQIQSFDMKELLKTLVELQQFQHSPVSIYIPIYANPNLHGLPTIQNTDFNTNKIYIHITSILLKNNKIIIDTPQFHNSIKKFILKEKIINSKLSNMDIPIHFCLLQSRPNIDGCQWKNYIDFYTPHANIHSLNHCQVLDLILQNTAELSNNLNESFKGLFKTSILPEKFTITKKDIYEIIQKLIN